MLKKMRENFQALIARKAEEAKLAKEEKELQALQVHWGTIYSFIENPNKSPEFQ